MNEVARYAAELRTLADGLEQRADAAVRKTGLDVEADAKILAPVDTGNLRNSITTTISGGGMTAEIGPAAAYGIYVEMGTRRMRPQPYMLPALQSQQGAFEQAVSQIVDGLL